MSLLIRQYVFLLIFPLLLLPAVSHAEWYQQQQPIMGTAITAEVWDTDPQHAHECIDRVMAEMHRINASMSPYREDSALSQINREADRQPVALSQELFTLIDRSLEFSRRSHGAFDISFASVGYLYDYRHKTKPSAQQVQGATIDYRQIVLDPAARTITFNKPGMRIDLGGIAKGYAVDNSIKILQDCGITHARVSAGGDSRLLGDRRGRPWMIGIRHPRQEQGSVLALPLSDVAVSTSGDYERYFEQDGERYHHILSPRTGKSAKGVWSVTVIGAEATTTDALSTTLFVLGVQAGLEFVNQLTDIDAVMIDDRGKVHYSQGLMPARP
ncbi:MAG: FAD:protein FMN transferase [Gammaproteobacteria bacterium]